MASCLILSIKDMINFYTQFARLIKEQKAKSITARHKLSDPKLLGIMQREFQRDGARFILLSCNI